MSVFSTRTLLGLAFGAFFTQAWFVFAKHFARFWDTHTGPRTVLKYYFGSSDTKSNSGKLQVQTAESNLPVYIHAGLIFDKRCRFDVTFLTWSTDFLLGAWMLYLAWSVLRDGEPSDSKNAASIKESDPAKSNAVTPKATSTDSQLNGVTDSKSEKLGSDDMLSESVHSPGPAHETESLTKSETVTPKAEPARLSPETTSLRLSLVWMLIFYAAQVTAGGICHMLMAYFPLSNSPSNLLFDVRSTEFFKWINSVLPKDPLLDTGHGESMTTSSSWFGSSLPSNQYFAASDPREASFATPEALNTFFFRVVWLICNLTEGLSCAAQAFIGISLAERAVTRVRGNQCLNNMIIAPESDTVSGQIQKETIFSVTRCAPAIRLGWFVMETSKLSTANSTKLLASESASKDSNKFNTKSPNLSLLSTLLRSFLHNIVFSKTFWLTYTFLQCVLICLGQFSHQRPAADPFLLGVMQAPPTAVILIGTLLEVAVKEVERCCDILYSNSSSKAVAGTPNESDPIKLKFQTGQLPEKNGYKRAAVGEVQTPHEDDMSVSTDTGSRSRSESAASSKSKVDSATSSKSNLKNGSVSPTKAADLVVLSDATPHSNPFSSYFWCWSWLFNTMLIVIFPWLVWSEWPLAYVNTLLHLGLTIAWTGQWMHIGKCFLGDRDME